MIQLATVGKSSGLQATLVGIVKRNQQRDDVVFVTSEMDENILCRLTTQRLESSSEPFSSPAIHSIKSVAHLNNNDIVAVSPSGLINTLFRSSSDHNALFITERCNSNCLMCSQPPRDIDDLDFLYNINYQVVSLLSKDIKVLGITGGEPTILGARLINLLALTYEKLPTTLIHMLSNGRAYSRKEYAENTANSNPNLRIGIPLYSDNFIDHNYIVQNNEAFEQTVVGFHNLERYGQSSELRVVLMRLNYKRLTKLANFIYKNLPFIDHVAFMGLEVIGYAPHNKNLLWIEPTEYAKELEDAVLFLDSIGMHVSIYNLPLCVLKKPLWRFARKSISDWKQTYIPECDKCKERNNCCGVFGTSKYLSDEIKAIVD